MKIGNITSNYYPKQKNRSNCSFNAVKGLGPDFGKNIKELTEILAQNEELLCKFNAQLSVLNEKFTQISKLKKKLKIKAQMNLKEELAKLTQEIKSAVGLSQSTNATQKVCEANTTKPITHKFNYVKGFGMSKIAGYEETKKTLNEYFISKIKLEKEGKDVDIPSAFFFFGPKGNGKTTSAMAIAEETCCNISKLLISKN